MFRGVASKLALVLLLLIAALFFRKAIRDR